MNSYMVVDASVSLKWALDDEESVDQAVGLRNMALSTGLEFVAPSLWLYEVINGLGVAVRRGRIAQDAAEQALDHLLALGIRLADPPAERVYQLALGTGLAAYDAAYLALAEALGVSLWTGDRILYDRARAKSEFVHWIGDFSQPA